MIGTVLQNTVRLIEAPKFNYVDKHGKDKQYYLIETR